MAMRKKNPENTKTKRYNIEPYLLECKKCEPQRKPLIEYTTQFNMHESIEKMLKIDGLREL